MKNIRTILFMAMVLGLSVQAHATVYTDEATFISDAALAGLSTSSDSFGSYSLGNIANGQTLGDFTYSYASSGPTATQPGIASNGSGGQALGDTSLGTDPNSGTGVFVGGEAVTLMYNGANPLIAFGAEFSYAPNFEALPDNLYQLTVQD